MTGKSVFELQAQAVHGALADAGLDISDVDGLATTAVAPKFDVSVMAEYLGIRPTWLNGTNAGGASFELMLADAIGAVDRGDANVVVVSYGSNQRSASSRSIGGVKEEGTPLADYEMPFGPLLPISAYALAAQRYLHEFGSSRELFAEVAIAAREWALLNPLAYRYGSGPLTVEEVLASDMVSDPLGRLDCCLVTDGGGAVVITSEDRARDTPKGGIRLLGSAHLSTHRVLSAMPSLTRPGSYTTGPRAFDRAGVTPKDIDVVQIYDSFTITALLSLEGLGFCEPGEAGDFLSDGRARPGGSFPMNTSGGGLSYCHPGMLGIFLIIEAVQQLRGESGDRQVRDAETALCHATGGYFNTHSTLILARQ